MGRNDPSSKFAIPTPSSYTSTTDDDEGLTFQRRPAHTTSSSSSHLGGQPTNLPPLHIPSTSSSLQKRRNIKVPTVHHSSPLSLSPLSHPSSSPALLEDEWDYSETEFWGWVVLFVTWIVFVIGMGSCLGVWSWAWDVGETPYATPPELGNDPTLPIVGYYPALIILTAIVAWVWVVVAWVGMKYFRHSKMVLEEE